jgi:hypothetical protein
MTFFSTLVEHGRRVADTVGGPLLPGLQGWGFLGIIGECVEETVRESLVGESK